MTGNILAHNYKLVKGQALIETALTDAKFPLSGSFVDCSGYERVHILIDLGTVVDAVVFAVQEADSASGTPTDIDTTNLKHTLVATDDGQMVSFTLETAHLTEGDNWITVDVSATSGSNYAAITYLLEGLDLPVTQTAGLLPSASQYNLTG